MCVCVCVYCESLWTGKAMPLSQCGRLIRTCHCMNSSLSQVCVCLCVREHPSVYVGVCFGVCDV